MSLLKKSLLTAGLALTQLSHAVEAPRLLEVTFSLDRGSVDTLAKRQTIKIIEEVQKRGIKASAIEKTGGEVLELVDKDPSDDMIDFMTVRMFLEIYQRTYIGNSGIGRKSFANAVDLITNCPEVMTGGDCGRTKKLKQEAINEAMSNCQSRNPKSRCELSLLKKMEVKKDPDAYFFKAYVEVK